MTVENFGDQNAVHGQFRKRKQRNFANKNSQTIFLMFQDSRVGKANE